MAKSKSIFWWGNPEDLKLWTYLNSIDPIERLSKDKYERVSKEMIERYGNLFFYQPIPKLLDFHKDSNPVKIAHGNNSSGKSYAAGAEIAYKISGKSPYREFALPPTGTRVIWIITQNFDIQKDSSQTILFSNLDSPIRDIGLLPDISTLQSLGCEVEWHKKNVLRAIRLPDGTRIEFKSYEQEAFAIAGAAVDDIWLDELAKANVFDEASTRVLRKYGEVVMSCLVEDVEDSYLVTDIYDKYKEDIKKLGKSKLSFYFVAIEDNVYLDPQKIKEHKALISEGGKAWRFSKGGEFTIIPKGTIVYENYQEPLHLVDDLITQFDHKRTLYRAWDLGYDRPACIGFQIDEFARVLILFSFMGKKIQLRDFIDYVKGQQEGILPETPWSEYEVLPHDANRVYDVSPSSAADVFTEKGLGSFDVIYVNAEKAILSVNRMLSELKASKPALMIDSQFANLVGNVCALYSRNEKTGRPKTSRETELAHISDALKLAATFIDRKLRPGELAKFGKEVSKIPGYSRGIGRVQVEGY